MPSWESMRRTLGTPRILRLRILVLPASILPPRSYSKKAPGKAVVGEHIVAPYGELQNLTARSGRSPIKAIALSSAWPTFFSLLPATYSGRDYINSFLL